MFRHRVFPIGAEWTGTWVTSVVFGVLLSAAMILTGSMLSLQWLWLLTVVVALLLLINQVWLLSPVYTLGIVAITMWLINTFNVQLPDWLSSLSNINLVLVSYVLMFLLIVEIILFATAKRNQSFPELQKASVVNLSEVTW